MIDLYYYKVLELVEDAKSRATHCILYEYNLRNLALFLKNKFNDKRSVRELLDILVEEYNLEHKTTRFITSSFL